MIRLIETRNFRNLRSIWQPLDNFQVLVGANASGKTTFLDTVSFVADLVANGVDYAISQRTQNFLDLTFAGKGGDIEVALEIEIPEELLNSNFLNGLDRIRYEVSVGLTKNTNEHAIKKESVTLVKSQDNEVPNNVLDKVSYPRFVKSFNSIFRPGFYFLPIIINSSISIYDYRPDGSYDYRSEVIKDNGSSNYTTFHIGIKKSALGNLPADVTQFPISNWLKDFLQNGVQPFVLDSLNIRKASPPGQSRKFKTDGSNLPWVIEDLKKKDENVYRDWVQHVRTALPDIKEILTVDRADDRHRYLKIKYDNGIEVPSWMVSDGTLRLLALTLPAYLPDFEGAYLIEEPENGIHPRAIETVFQSLSSVYNAQILLATHSPVILSMVELKSVLCFAKTANGETDIINGADHPMLQDWKGETNLSILFAAGVLS